MGPDKPVVVLPDPVMYLRQSVCIPEQFTIVVIDGRRISGLVDAPQVGILPRPWNINGNDIASGRKLPRYNLIPFPGLDAHRKQHLPDLGDCPGGHGPILVTP